MSEEKIFITDKNKIIHVIFSSSTGHRHVGMQRSPLPFHTIQQFQEKSKATHNMEIRNLQNPTVKEG